MSESQRAVTASKIANVDHGGDRKSDQEANLPLEPFATPVSNAFDQTANLRTDQAAAMMNVSPRTVDAARKVQEVGVPRLGAAL
jgi:hypothetical protein